MNEIQNSTEISNNREKEAENEIKQETFPEVETPINSNVNNNEGTEEGSQTLLDALEKYHIREKYPLIKLTPKKIRLLEQYCQELWSLNQSINLTRHTTFDKFVCRDLIDTMELSLLLQQGEHILDVGTGGGVPGIPLAILRPDLVVELCDSTGKKAEAVGTIVDALGLDLNVWYAKAEDLVKVHRFHTLVVRAVSKMEKLLRNFAALWFAFDRILMIKGPHWTEERGEARHYNQLNKLALRKVAEFPDSEEQFNSVILQVCQKKRFEELQKRDQDRLDGKPIEQFVEKVGVDNKKRDSASSPRSKYAKKANSKLTDGSRSKKVSSSSFGQPSNSKRDSRRKGSPHNAKSSKQAGSAEKRGRGWVDKEKPFHSPLKSDKKK
ncbi:MAG: 16S rRNA (guanine(527)-N(7))-methyltransferase RsmG [Planctomycetia bacterium]|nr:16S rRNA (guanine(527)-N(7))-methyltransferase RsmG [Planctomycetia bacterium]